MAEPKFEQNGIVWAHYVDKDTSEVTSKRLRRVYTDMINENEAILENKALIQLLREAKNHPANEGVDWFDVRPWRENPNA